MPSLRRRVAWVEPTPGVAVSGARRRYSSSGRGVGRGRGSCCAPDWPGSTGGGGGGDASGQGSAVVECAAVRFAAPNGGGSRLVGCGFGVVTGGRAWEGG